MAAKRGSRIGKVRRTRRSTRIRAGLESLESRLLLAQTVDLGQVAQRDELLDGLDALRIKLSDLSDHQQFGQTVQLVEESFGQRLDMGDALADGLMAVADSYLSGFSPTAAGLSAELGALNVTTPDYQLSVIPETFDFEITDQPDGQRLRYSMVFQAVSTDPQRPLDIDFTGLTMTDLAADVTRQFQLDFSFGLTPGETEPEFFAQVNDLTAIVSAHDPTDNPTGLRGFAEVEVEPHSSFEVHAGMSAAFGNPDGDSEGLLSALELLGNGVYALTSVSADPQNTIDIVIPVDVEIGPYAMAGDPSLAVFSNDPLAGGQPDYLWNEDAAPLEVFETVGPNDMLGLLSQVGNWLPGLTDADAFDAPLPMTGGARLSDLIDLAQLYASNAGDHLTSVPDVPSFLSAQQLAQVLSDGSGYPVQMIPDFDPVTNELEYHVQWEHSPTPIVQPLDFGEDLAGILGFSTSSTIQAQATTLLDITFGIDLTPLGEAFELSESTNVEDLNAGLGVPLDPAVDDMVISFRDGSTWNVNLGLPAHPDDVVTVGDVLAVLNADPRLSVQIATDDDALRLIDETEGPGTFSVDFSEDSLAAGALRIVGVDDDHDGVLFGLPLHGERLVDRFYVAQASLDSQATLSAPDVDASIQLAGLQLNAINGEAAAAGNLHVQFQDPGSPDEMSNLVYDGRIRIDELADAIIGNGSTNPPLSVTSLIDSAQLTGSAELLFEHLELQGNLPGVLPEDAWLSVQVPDLAMPSEVIVEHNLEIESLQQLGFEAIVDMLREVADFLGDVEGTNFLQHDLPIIDRSLGELIGMSARLHSALDQVEVAEPETYDEFETALQDGLGIGDEQFALAFDPQNQRLNVDLAFVAQYGESQSLNLDIAQLLAGVGGSVEELNGLGDLFDAGASSNIATDLQADVDLDLGIDLSDPENPQFLVENTTNIELSADIHGTGLEFTAALGPLGLFISGGEVDINDLQGGDATVSIGLDDMQNEYLLTALGPGSLDFDVTAGARLDLPVYFPTDAVPLNHPDTADNSLRITIPDLAAFLGGAQNVVVENTPDLAGLLDGLSLAENLYVLVDGLDWLLGKLQDSLSGDAFATRLPLIGDELQDVGTFIEDLREGFLTDLQNFLALPPTPDMVQDALYTLLGPDDRNILLDTNDDGPINKDDVVMDLIDMGGNGPEEVRFALELGDSIQLANVPLDLGIDSLGFNFDADVVVTLTYAWTLAFGVNKTDGFFIDTTADDDLAITLSAEIPNAQFEGSLWFLNLLVEDDGSSLAGDLTVDLTDPDGPDGDGIERMTMAEIGAASISEIVDVGLNVTADVDLDLEVSFGESEIFPSLLADFDMLWVLDVLNPDEADGISGEVTELAFNNVSVGLGSFFSDFAGPIIDKFKVVLDPIKPVVDVIQKRVPVLSDIKAARKLLDYDPIHDEVSVLDLALHFGLGGDNLEYLNDFLKFYDIYSKLSDAVDATKGTELQIELGDLNLLDFVQTGDLSGELDIDLTTMIVDDLILGELFDGPAGDFFERAAAVVSPDGPLFEGLSQEESKLSFPIIENPRSAFGLLLGQDPALVTFDLKPLEASFNFSEFFPIFWFLGVDIEGGIGLTADLAFGYDTKGFRDFVQGGFVDVQAIKNGLYISDTGNPEGTGEDVAEVELWGFLNVAGGLKIPGVKAVVGGGIEATIEGNLNDIDGDGKFRLDELVELFPDCILDLHGELTAGAFAEVKIGIGKLAYTKTWDIATKTLAEFEYHCDVTTPVLATETQPGVLRLNMGPSAAARINGDLNGNAGETFEVTHASGGPGNETVIVSAFGYSQEYAGISKVVADGGGGNDVIEIDAAVLAAAELSGGAGDDILIGGGGPASLYGNDGFDQLTGGSAGDFLYGGDDDDLLDGGEGDDLLQGGQGADNLYGQEGFDTLDGGSGDDLLFGGDDDDTLSGGAGQDQLEGEDGDDVLRGDTAGDSINGGYGDDYVEGGSGDDVIVGGHDDDRILAGTGNDLVYGGQGDDSVDGGAGNDEIHGEDGLDVLRGNAGNDSLTGGQDADTMFGGSGQDHLSGDHGNDEIEGGIGNDILIGGLGNDLLSGNNGDDFIRGNEGQDVIRGNSGHDQLFGDSDDDTVIGGSGQDLLEGDTGNDELRGNTGIDIMTGGPDDDLMFGGPGDDRMYGMSGTDTMWGEAGRDRLEAAEGDDFLAGGDDSDLLIGDLGFDTLLGGWGDDVVYGHLIGDRSTVTGEYIEGGPDDDFICGTDGVDQIFGGTSDVGLPWLDLDPPTVVLSGGFRPTSCHTDDEPPADFPYDPEVDDDPADETARIAGTKFEDLNGNGIREPGEPPIGNVRIYVDLNENGSFEAGEPNSLTDVEGHYLIEELGEGSFVVREDAPGDQVVTVPSEGFHKVDLELGDILEGVDFGNGRRGHIVGTKWIDIDGDGKRGPNEPAQHGVVFYLDLNHDGRPDRDEPTTQTDAAGTYLFTDVAPGTYTLREIVPAGFIPTSPAGHQPRVVQVMSGTTTPGGDFGNFQNQEIRGTVWVDRDGNGGRDAGEPGLEGVTIYLDLNDNGVADAGEPTTVSLADNPYVQGDEAGTYRFTQVPAGSYVVREVTPDGYQPTHPHSGFHSVDVVDGAVATGVNFGNRPLVVLRGTKWNDLDGDGRRDEGEPGLEGVTIYLDLNRNQVHDTSSEPFVITSGDDPTTRDDETGRYEFRDLPAGDYSIAEIVPIGSTRSYPDQAAHQVVLAEPTTVNGLDFGNYEHAEIRGTTWSDFNADGARNLGEPPLPGVTVYLDANGNGVFDAGERFTVSMHDDVNTPQVNESGLYRFDQLVAGPYTVRAIPPADHAPTSPLDAPGRHDFSLGAGESRVGVDFGSRPVSGRLAGTKWVDLDGDGIRDPGEPGLAGVVIYLDNNSNGAHDLLEPVTVSRHDDPDTAEDETGTWLMTGLSEGTYTVREIVPDNFAQTFPGVPLGAHGVTLSLFQPVSGLDFGNLPRFQFVVPFPMGPNVEPTGGQDESPGNDDNADSHETEDEVVLQNGAADDGPEAEEDEPWDYGDAPSPFSTVAGEGGARHLITAGMYLGQRIDGEADGQPHEWGLGDDLTGLDDEDGVVFLTQLFKGQQASILVTASVTGFLHAWLDANGDGDWDDDGEQIYEGEPLMAGENELSFTVPQTESPQQMVPQAAIRVRYGTQQQLGYSGPADNGEVEDYVMRVLAAQNDTLPRISSAPREIIEEDIGTKELIFTLSLSHPSDQTVSVDFSTIDGTATSGLDYVAASGTAVFHPGETIAEIVVPIIGEYLFEADETFELILENAVGATIGNPSTTATILNDDSRGEQGGITGLKWIDRNDDGDRDPGEPGKSGVLVYADINGNMSFDVGEPFDVTAEDDPSTGIDETGTYLLNGVPAGLIIVSEVVPDQWTPTFPIDGAQQVQVLPGETVTGVDFGNIKRLLDGDDTIFAAAAGDPVYGDNLVSDPDVVSSGTRRDTIHGEAGQDELYGQEREDLLIGGEDADALDGGADIDRVFQEVDNDQVLTNGLLTGQGPDTLVDIERATLIGGAGDNVIDASAFTLGPVILIGLGGDDHLIATSFGDLLVGGDGSDSMEGGDGGDIYEFSGVTSGVEEQDVLLELDGQGFDTLDFSGLPEGDDLSIDLSGAGLPSFGSHQLRELRIPEAQVIDQPSFERVVGGGGDDLLVGNADDNALIGNEGDDTLFGGPGNDFLDGGAGNDLISGDEDDDQLVGGADNDHFLFASQWGVDMLDEAGGADDHLDFSAVIEDLLVDVSPLHVGDGENSVVVAAASLIERVTTGSGHDVILFSHDGANLAGGAGIVDAGPGVDTLNYSAVSAAVSLDVNLLLGTADGLGSVANVENVIGGDGNDSLVGDDAANQLRGGPGNDFLNGNGGDDVLTGDEGSDTQLGGDGNDVLLGGAGPDTLDGGLHDDVLRGEADDDLYLFGPDVADEQDVVAELAGGGLDWLDFGAGDEAVEVDLVDDTIATTDSGRIVVVEAAGMSLQFENVRGTPLGDTIRVNGADNRIAGMGGDDAYLFPDGLTGTVRLLEDPGQGVDRIVLADFSAAVQFDLSSAVNMPIVGLDVRLLDSSESDAPNNFEDLVGGTGDDQLRGNLNDNQIFGGEGSDTLFGAAGSNQLHGEQGDDVYVFDATTVANTLHEDATAAGGSDTLDFSASPEAITIDMDLDGATQIVTGAGQNLQLNGAFENLVGSSMSDTVSMDASNQPRSVDGGDPTAPETPGDTLSVDLQGVAFDYAADQLVPVGLQPITIASIETLNVENSAAVTVDAGSHADDGLADFFTVVADATHSLVVVNGEIAFQTPLASTPHITIQGSSDDDTLIVSFASGNPIPNDLAFHGAGQGTEDLLILFGTGDQDGIYEPDPENFGDGTIMIDGDTIEFTGLEPVVVSQMLSFTLRTTGSQDDLIVDSPEPGRNRISGTSDGVPFEVLEFHDVDHLTIDVATHDVEGRDDDVVTFASDLVAAGLRSFSVETGSDGDVVDVAAVTGFSLTQQDGRWVLNSGDDLQSPVVMAIDVNSLPEDPADLPSTGQPTSWQQQRSDIRSIVIRFNETVTLDRDQLRLVNLGVDPDNDPDVEIPLDDVQLTHVGLEYRLVFRQAQLTDGVYRLEILPTVTDLAGNPLDGDGDGTGGDALVYEGNVDNRFYRLLTDFNGDNGISIFDFSTIAYWFGHSTGPQGPAPEYGDLNDDAGVSIFDFTIFAARFGQHLALPAPPLSAGTAGSPAFLVGEAVRPTSRPVESNEHAENQSPIEVRAEAPITSAIRDGDQPRSPAAEREGDRDADDWESLLDVLADDVVREWRGK